MYIDAHCHLDRYDLIDDEEALGLALAEITQHQILTISNSMDLPSYQRNLEISQLCNLVVPIFGIHPWNAPEYADRLDELGDAIEKSPMIGEIGLDHHFVKDSSAYPAQRKVFEFLMGSARAQNKIVTLHTKGAEREVLALLDQYALSRVIVHWYSGPLEILRELIASGATFTVGPEIHYSEHIRTIAREIPARQLLTETDNPGGPMGFMGKVGTPLLVQDVVRGLAEARGTTTESIVRTVQVNLMELIRDDRRLLGMRAVLEEWQGGG